MQEKVDLVNNNERWLAIINMPFEPQNPTVSNEMDAIKSQSK